MNQNQYPLYLFLGPKNKERDAILADLRELDAPAEATIVPVRAETIGSLELPENVPAVFLVAEGDLIDTLESLGQWLTAHDRELTRVITIFPLALLRAKKEVMGWLEAAVFFSDVLLLTQTESLEKSFIRESIDVFSEQRCYPCLIEAVPPSGKCRNPALVLDSEVRRMSHYFEGEEAIAECDENEDLQAFSSVFPIKNPDRDYFTRSDDGYRLYPLPQVETMD